MVVVVGVVRLYGSELDRGVGIWQGCPGGRVRDRL